MTYPGEKDYISKRKDLERQLKDNKEEAKRAKELWETIKDLSYDDLCILSGLIVEHTKPMMEAKEKALNSQRSR